MRILQIAPYFPPYNGGQEKYAYNLGRQLVMRGHEVHVVTSNFPKSNIRDVLSGMTVERHNCLARPLRNPIAPGILSIERKVKEYDVIQTHNEHSFAALAAIYFRKKMNISLVSTCHGQLRFGNPFFDTIERMYNRSIGRKIFKLSDCIVALSNADLEYISSLGIDAGKIEVIPNAIDPSELEKLSGECSDLDSIRDKYNLGEKRIVLFVGPVIKRKGVEYLIRAVSSVLKSMKEDIAFVLVGGGDYINEAKQLITAMKLENNVILTDLISMQELVRFYKSSALFTLPSLSEGVPTSILESFYFGLPVISTSIPGIRDHFKDYALLVPKKDSIKLADAIIHILNNEDLARDLSMKGKKLIKEYTWDAVARRYEALYRGTGPYRAA